jgi:hypothetical protein
MALATVGILYDQGLAGEGLIEPAALIDHEQVMAESMALFDEAIERASGRDFNLPFAWMRVETSAEGFVRIVHSMKARYLAASARTPEERQALPWSQILADVRAGIAQDLVAHYDDDTYWHWDVGAYGTYFGWSQLSPFIYGMSDQSGNYQRWVAEPMADKSYQFPDATPVLFITPDLRFPQGGTVAEQRASETPERYFRVERPGAEHGYTWARPDRGTWRWSWYKHNRFERYWNQLDYNVVEIPVVEMRLLEAEGLYHQGDRAGAATLLNETRLSAGLSAADASGTNVSCVPKLPDGSCGGLFEMLKWEKRVEATFKGPLGVPWYFDGRGWGDLWKDTFLELPVPCEVMQAEQLGACYTYGGPGGAHAAAPSTYHWPGEG